MAGAGDGPGGEGWNRIAVTFECLVREALRKKNEQMNKSPLLNVWGNNAYRNASDSLSL
jgi:hypothetical protein